MDLVIVESPTKAKTIGKFLPKGKFKVKSSYGHVRDLPEKAMGVDVSNNFSPKYVISEKAKARVKELKAEAKKSARVILATDEDREGEAIAWHLCEILNLPLREQNRIVFHEITKKAIEKALENPRRINLNLVDAQQARRILDRLVGYELSPFLWKKVRRGLSAGRVQSIAVRFIVEREREIEKFKPKDYFTITVSLKPEGSDEEFSANLFSIDGGKIEKQETLKLFAGDYRVSFTSIESEEEAFRLVNELKDAFFKIKDIAKKEIKRNPPSPFITSTLQQSAINGLGFSAKKTMMIAQKLYERGFITYMRTDSVNLSLESMLAAKKAIIGLFGEKYAVSEPRFFKTKSRSAQEAHEAIRPSDPTKTPQMLSVELNPNEFKLYQLIWSRMIASQMQPAIWNSTKVTIGATSKKGKDFELTAAGSTLVFDGYLKAWKEGKKNGEINTLPELIQNQALNFVHGRYEKKNTQPPPRYSEASLIKALEEYGIGRPSTYAPILSTIIERKYIEKKEDKKLVPLEIGFLVNDILVEHFKTIVDVNFTARLEEDLDLIANGQKKWVPVVKEFYEPFHQNLENKTKVVNKDDFIEKLGRQCPNCSGELVVRFGRFGKFIACSNYPKCHYTEKTENKNNDKNGSVVSGEYCEKCGAPMIKKYGPYGEFLGCSKYPECKNIKKIENDIGVECPACGQGQIVEKKSRTGKIFYSCNRYPDCKYALWLKPNGKKCPVCANLMVIQAKGVTACSNKECDYKEN